MQKDLGTTREPSGSLSPELTAPPSDKQAASPFEESEAGPEAEANAHLIAAAPQMLMTLRFIMGQLASFYLEKRKPKVDELFQMMTWAAHAVGEATGHHPLDPETRGLSDAAANPKVLREDQTISAKRG